MRRTTIHTFVRNYTSCKKKDNFYRRFIFFNIENGAVTLYYTEITIYQSHDTLYSYCPCLNTRGETVTGFTINHDEFP